MAKGHRPKLRSARLSRVLELRCRECGRSAEVAPVHVCDFCFAPLEPTYDYDAVAATISRDSIAAGPPNIWRYAELLPVEDSALRIDLGVGMTPLIRSERLGRALGIERLYLKNDMANPTHSFKDRVVSVAATVARSMGFMTLACASTGNLANSVAAHAARAGMRCIVFIPADLEAAKVLTTAIYGATVVGVKGSYDEVNRLCSEVAGEREDWAFVNVNIRPFYAEGSKTLAFEVVEQLDYDLPDHVVVPVASGSLLTKFWKGLGEMNRVGLAEVPTTKLHAAQAQGCSPVVEAIVSGAEQVRPVKPQTIAKSLAIGNPADGYYAARVVDETGGRGAAVSDEEILRGIELLATTEGLFTETAGGVTIAVLKKLADQGVFSAGESVVALITGMGLKTAEALGERPGSMIEIRPSIEEFNEQLRIREELEV